MLEKILLINKKRISLKDRINEKEFILQICKEFNLTKEDLKIKSNSVTFIPQKLFTQYFKVSYKWDENEILITTEIRDILKILFILIMTMALSISIILILDDINFLPFVILNVFLINYIFRNFFKKSNNQIFKKSIQMMQNYQN